jgi:hypothetical protein
MVKNIFNPEIILLGNIKMVNQMEKVNLYGQMEINMKVNFRMDWDGVKDNGKKKLRKVGVFIKDNM